MSIPYNLHNLVSVFCVAVLAIFYSDVNSFCLELSQNKDNQKLQDTSVILGTLPKRLI